MVEAAARSAHVLDLYREHNEQIERSLTVQHGVDDVVRSIEHQNRNPVTLLTSGPVERSETLIRRTCTTTYERRVHWWNGYDDGVFCVFGHYSRKDGTFFGSRSSYCIDFGAGRRWTERRDGDTGPSSWKLAALRYPEKIVVFDDGACRAMETSRSTSRDPAGAGTRFSIQSDGDIDN
jgi:hypothetical protein